MLLFVFAVIILIDNVKCNKNLRIVDRNVQRYIIEYEDYCPEIGSCEEGTHTLCLYYNPDQKMGPMCTESEKISITPYYANLILSIVNQMRSVLAHGKETGKDNIQLPKAFGMFRLEWDEELATFAQIWADQCTLTLDRCRATKKFPEPGQTAGGSRFKLNWETLTPTNLFNRSHQGFVREKVTYAIKRILRSWYLEGKRILTPEVVNNVQNYNLITYFQVIYGPSTHVGCGISTYKEFQFLEGGKDLLFNTVRLVCNFSSRIKPNVQLYTTEPPMKPGWTIGCGCPPTYDEDIRCLCSKYDTDTSKKKCHGANCVPTMVILPIFTLEDAAVKKLSLEREALSDKERVKNVQSRPQDDELESLLEAIHKDDIGRSEDKILDASKYMRYSNIEKNYPLKGKQHIFVNSNLDFLTTASTTKTDDAFDKMIQYVFPRIYPSNTDIAKESEYDEIFNQTIYESQNLKGVSDLKLKTKVQSLDPKSKYHENIKETFNNTKKESNIEHSILKKVADDKIMILLHRLQKEVRDIKLSQQERETVNETLNNIYNALVGNSFDIKNRFIEYGLNNNDSLCNNCSIEKYKSKLMINKNNTIHKQNIEKDKTQYLHHSNNYFDRNVGHQYYDNIHFLVPDTIPIEKILRKTVNIQQNRNTQLLPRKIKNTDLILRTNDSDGMLHYSNKRQFLKTLENIEQELRNHLNLIQYKTHQHKIFSATTTTSNSNVSPDNVLNKTVPRNQFLNSRESVFDYVNKAYVGDDLINNSSYKVKTSPRFHNKNYKSKSTQENATEKIRNVNLDSKSENQPIKQETDQKILMLLDKLEKEVTNMGLDIHEREMVDKRLVNIYRTLMKNSNLFDKNYDHIENLINNTENFCYHGKIPKQYRHLTNSKNIIQNDNRNLPIDKDLLKENDNLEIGLSRQDYNYDINNYSFRTMPTHNLLRNILDIQQYGNTGNARTKYVNNNIFIPLNDDRKDLTDHSKRNNFLNTLDNIEQEIRNDRNFNKQHIVMKENVRPRTEIPINQDDSNVYLPADGRIYYQF